MAAHAREVYLAARAQKLERIYQDCLRISEATQQAEEKRRLRLKIALIDAENQELRDCAHQQKNVVEACQNDRDDMSERLTAMVQTLETAQADLRVKARQIETLQNERNGLRDQNTDSSKTLAEKVALAREVSTLRLEVEHLRSQVSSNQHTISEKLSLQRQLRAIEVELENEKRFNQKTQTHASNRIDSESQKFRDLQSELDKEINERKRIETEAQKLAANALERQGALEAGVDVLQSKLTKANEQLAAAQEQLRSNDARDATSDVEELRENVKKRKFAQVNSDATIGTPGPVLANKRGKRANSAQPGEKSEFSITPFLSRASAVTTGSPIVSPSRSRNGTVARTGKPKNTVKLSANKKPEIGDTPGVMRSKSLGPATVGRGNAGTKTKVPRSLSAPKLDRVVEENEENILDEGGTNASRSPVMPTAPTESIKQPDFVKKKAKFLGRTLFDDENGSIPPQRPVGLLGNKPPFTGFNKVQPQSPMIFGMGIGKSVTGFGAISPLKKQRRLNAG